MIQCVTKLFWYDELYFKKLVYLCPIRFVFSIQYVLRSEPKQVAFNYLHRLKIIKWFVSKKKERKKNITSRTIHQINSYEIGEYENHWKPSSGCFMIYQFVANGAWLLCDGCSKRFLPPRWNCSSPQGKIPFDWLK